MFGPINKYLYQGKFFIVGLFLALWERGPRWVPPFCFN